MKSTCVLPPLSDILNPIDYYYNDRRPGPYQKPFSLQVAHLLLDEDYEDEPVKAKRKRATPSQLSVLNKVFEQTFFPSTELRIQLGKQLGMSPRTVQIWFQNKRQSIRTRERTTSPPPPPISPSNNTQCYYAKPDLPPLRYNSFSSITTATTTHSADISLLFRDYY